MLALEGRFALSFFLGVVAAVNPCGFVMLPAYLMYFLGLEGSRPDGTRASVKRALVVSAATSAGFIAVFFVIGAVSQAFTSFFLDNAKYVALFIGIGMIILGCFLLAGWKPAFATPTIGEGKQRDRTVVSMFGFGVAYAVASLGCTLPLVISSIFTTFGSRGVLSGLISVTLFGVGMGLLVTALTVSLAFASVALLRVLRNGMRYVDRVAAVFVMATGFYLTWYWYTAIADRTEPDGLTDRVESWQGDVHAFLERQNVWTLGIVLGALVLAGIVFVVLGKRRTSPPDASSDA